MAEFHVTQRTSGDTVVLELSGRLDGSAAERIERLHHVFQDGTNAVLVDFSHVDYINSTGIALVVGLAARARSNGSPMLVCGLSDHYTHIFQITRIADFVEMHPDQADALAPVTDEPQPTG